MMPSSPARPIRWSAALEAIGAWLLALVWIAPLLFALWASLRAPGQALDFSLAAPFTFENYRAAWAAAPWPVYALNTLALVSFTLVGQLVLCTLAGYAFARFRFPGREALFVLVLLQLFVLPEVLIVENYAMISRLALLDTIAGMGLPYVASAFGIFLLRQAFKSVPVELEEAARVEGCSWLGVLWRVYVPAARPVYLAYALVSVATHWNNFLWPLIVTNTPGRRPLTVGLSLFGAPESGVDISVISAATIMVVAPLLIAFLIFQRQFIQAFLRAGIR
ncbi:MULTISPECIES: carbohydrate ABC transporter permease [unclassified Xanthobacter]|uniref:carbohydrate ABC transporter permease n=1 Tax=unclassified Xanthobacter TaxID=2623496 RepID=UPI001F2884C1|nr:MULTISPECIES: carbohydrate ABC transporter permease [unclassified Xanthobacter]